MRDWVTNVADTYYLLGSALGAHPYPMMVRDFQKVIGEEARRQILEAEGRLPDAIFACVGGGTNAIGIFHAFLPDGSVELIGIEAGGRGDAIGEHAARFRGGAPGVLQGAYSYVLQDGDGQIALTHSVSAGLDYAMIGPEHAWLHDQQRAPNTPPLPTRKRSKPRACSRAPKASFRRSNRRTPSPRRSGARPRPKDKIFMVNLSGRGDKDIDIYRENFKELDEP